MDGQESEFDYLPLEVTVRVNTDILFSEMLIVSKNLLSFYLLALKETSGDCQFQANAQAKDAIYIAQCDFSSGVIPDPEELPKQGKYPFEVSSQ